MVIVSRSSTRDTPGKVLPAGDPKTSAVFFCAGASGKIHDPILMRFQPPVD
jgi:hypothetical protein